MTKREKFAEKHRAIQVRVVIKFQSCDNPQALDKVTETSKLHILKEN